MLGRKVRVVDIIAQQHDRFETDPARLVRRGGSANEEQTPRSGSAVRPSGRRKEAEKDVDSRAGETIAGGLFCCPATSVWRENCRHRWKTRLEKERRPRLVLQPTPETETHEIRGSTILLKHEWVMRFLSIFDSQSSSIWNHQRWWSWTVKPQTKRKEHSGQFHPFHLVILLFSHWMRKDKFWSQFQSP